jgi:hypothetical protein
LRAQEAALSVLHDLLSDAQTGYTENVRTILLRLRETFGEPAFADVERADFAMHVTRLIGSAQLTTNLRLRLISDLSSLGWWCNLDLGDAACAELAAVARRTYFQQARAIGHQMQSADPAALTAHAVFVGPLMGLLHSPTRGAFDYVRALCGDPDNLRIDVFHSGTLSPELAAYAAERLGPAAGRVNFFSISGDPDFLAKAAGRGPCTFHFWCEQAFAIHISLLALRGPTVMFTCGDAAPVQFADVYWYCHDDAYIDRLWRRKGAPAHFLENYRRLESAPVARSRPLRPRTRSDFGLRPEHTVIVTCGNRLGVDMDQAFVDGLGALLLGDPNLRWVVVGGLQDFWISAFGQVLGRQFIHIPFDADLASLFAVCDLFANPFRAGGGNTAIMAVEAGAAVVTRGDIGDVGAFVPAKHLAIDVESYFANLRSLVADPTLRRAWLAEQRVLLERRLDQDLFARELKGLTRLAYERFAARTPTALETIFAQPLPKRLALKGAARRPRLR